MKRKLWLTLALALSLLAMRSEARSLFESVAENLAGTTQSEIAIERQKQKEQSSEYHFIVWNVAKYKSLMRGVS